MSIATGPVPNLEIPPEEAKKHVGENVKVCGKITDAKFFESASKQTVISIGTSNKPLTVVISFEDRKNFSYKPENFLKNKSVCVSGRVVENNGRTELIVSKQEDIKIEEEDETEVEVKANYFDFFNKYFDDKE